MKEVIFITKGVQHIQVQAGTAYQLNAKDFDAKKSATTPIFEVITSEKL
jgi:hypothetical protein